LDIIQRLRSITKAVLMHLELHGQLARIEWKEEKIRLQQLLNMMLLGFACLISCLIAISILIVALTWATEYRIIAIVTLIIVYAVGLLLCGYRVNQLTARSSASFAATRAEISDDIALIRQQS
jgi:uncharacterized membrane protein YqjE